MPDPLEFGVRGKKSQALVYPCAGARATLILAHGAGGNQRHRWMVSMAEALLARRLKVVTFDFVYAHAGRRAPDTNELLEETWRQAANAIESRGARQGLLVACGKSMGGRIATQVAASTGLPGLAGLVLLGYPLHPPGKPSLLRTAHLERVAVPMLFVQGTRDPFGTPAELEPIVRALPARCRLYGVQGGDHSLAPLKSSGQTLAQVLDRVAGEAAKLVASLDSPGPPKGGAPPLATRGPA